ncbi:MAG: hypothetical protein ABIR29_14105 [Chthoniobacterales bacterium]
MKRLLFLLFILASATARAQTPSPSPSATPVPRLPYWRCELPGGTYEVAIRSIVSVSSHQYIVDGAARVNEVNVDTAGNMAVRFYYIEPTAAKSPLGVGQSAVDRVSELAKEAGQRVGADQVWERVVKTYPTTTHAHSIEYRVESEEQLKQIFSSAQEAFESGVTATFKLPDQ